MSTPERIEVALPGRGYDIVVGRGLLEDLPAHVELPADATAAVVTQPPIARRHAAPVEAALREAGLEVQRLTVPDGEGAKDLQVLGRLYGKLADVPLSRRDLVVALGGGVVGDLAGFAAATWNRGVAIVQVPTTLLAQVDAAIGGKTGVNLPAGKNLVGAFHQPTAVVADIDTLATLEPRILVEGYGEVVKCGLIRDEAILDLLEGDPEAAAAGEPDVLLEVVARTADVKAEVVAADEREAGERAHLNFGHTYGHALEAVTGFRHHLHGEAVAVGMCMALRLGARLGVTPPGLVGRTEALLTRLGLPTRTSPLERRRVWQVMRRDKKVAGGEVRFVLLDDIGAPRLLAPDPEDVDAAIDEVERG